MKRIGILNYGMGNITSVCNAIHKVGLSVEVIFEPEEISKYDQIILPGVGAFKQAMQNLRSKELDIAIIDHVKQGLQLVGICLGMQLLFSKSYEFGETSGLKLIEGDVLPFKDDIELTIPHMGWNRTKSSAEDYMSFEKDFYFVHSFYCKPKDSNEILFTTNYGIEFCSGVKKSDSIIGVQFHPEKSQVAGLSLLKHILE